jgi:Fic family protein
MRRTDVQRDSKPASHRLVLDPDEKAALEARNGLLQFDEVLSLIDQAKEEGKFTLRPSVIQRLHRIAIQDIYTCAGNYRLAPVSIEGTSHHPPPPADVAEAVEQMCDYVNNNGEKSPLHLSAYLMWRINWIHPFAGGNGRTSRAVSYLILGTRLGYRIPGTLTIPDQIVANRQPYYKALDCADAAWAGGALDVSVMEGLLSDMLAAQLLSILQAATGAESQFKPD